MEPTIALYTLGTAAAVVTLPKIKARLDLSRAKHRSLSGHSRMARRIAALMPFYEYDESSFFRSDDAPPDVEARRRNGFMQLSALYQERFRETLRQTADVEESLSDLQFTSAYRVPFQYSRLVRRHLKTGYFVQSSAGVMITDLDGNSFYDLTGSYGVNLFGYDFYKHCIERGVEQVKALGPVLGAYHPTVAYNLRRLREISGLDEVSFHMSGTEAVMQAVRLARYHTKRPNLVRFCGAYHGWWGDVQPGIGNPVPAHETFTLKDMDEDSLHVLRTRRDIACVLVNPLQALHPNAGAPADSGLIDSSRRAGFDRPAYTQWLQDLREVCTERGIVLDLRRSICRLQAGSGRSAGIFRCQGGHGHLRQDPCRWPAHRSGVRTPRVHEALPRRTSCRHLLCARHVQRPSLRHGGHERVPASSGYAGG